MKAESSIIIFSAADRNYIMPLAVTLKSLVLNTKYAENLEIHILDGGLTNSDKKRLLRSLELSKDQLIFHKQVDKDIPHVNHSSHLNKATSYRFLISEILSDEYEKVIYIDSDIVVTADVFSLWQMNTQNHVCAGVVDTYAPRADSEYGIKEYEQLRIPRDTRCLNAGVLLIDLKRWREERVSEKAFEFIDLYRDNMNLVSQEALNGVLRGNWLELPGKWNQLVNPLPFFNGKELENDFKKGILHFITANKPWQWDYPHPQKESFYHYLDKTSWKNWRPQEPSVFKKIIRKSFSWLND